MIEFWRKKFKLDYLRYLVKIQFLNQNMILTQCVERRERLKNWKEETKSGHDTSGKWEGKKILLHPKKEKKILPFLTVICP